MLFRIHMGERKVPENMEKKSNAAIWKETIALMGSSMFEVPEEKRQEYDNKIRQKLQSGKELTPEELNYLRIYQPELYRSAMRVENERKSLRTRLQNCRSKEEVENVVSVERQALRAAEGDVDREYMTAMVNHEVERFKQSSVYARLPRRREDRQGKGVAPQPEQESGDWQEAEATCIQMILGQMQLSCDRISQMSKAFAA